MAEIQEKDNAQFKCSICKKLLSREKLSFENEYDMIICHDCLDEQRNLDRIETLDYGSDDLRDFTEKVRVNETGLD